MSPTLQQRVIRTFGMLGISVAAIYAGQRPVYAQPVGRPQPGGPGVIIIAPPAGGPALNADFSRDPVNGCRGYTAAWLTVKANQFAAEALERLRQAKTYGLPPEVAQAPALLGPAADFRQTAEKLHAEAIDASSRSAFLAGNLQGVQLHQSLAHSYPLIDQPSPDGRKALADAYAAQPLTQFCGTVSDLTLKGYTVQLQGGLPKRPQMPSLHT